MSLLIIRYKRWVFLQSAVSICNLKIIQFSSLNPSAKLPVPSHVNKKHENIMSRQPWKEQRHHFNLEQAGIEMSWPFVPHECYASWERRLQFFEESLKDFTNSSTSPFYAETYLMQYLMIQWGWWLFLCCNMDPFFLLCVFYLDPEQRLANH